MSVQPLCYGKNKQTTVTVINNQLNQVYNLDGITMKKTSICYLG